MTLDAALEEALPDTYGFRWAVAHRAGDAYVCTDLDGVRTYARQWTYNGRLRGKTLKEPPEDLKWSPLAVGKLAA